MTVAASELPLLTCSCSLFNLEKKRFSIFRISFSKMIFHKHRDILSHRPWRAYYTYYTNKGQAPPLSLQGAFSDRKVAAIATFKKDTTLERQGEFTLSTLQGRCSRRRELIIVPDHQKGARGTRASNAPKASSLDVIG